MFSKWLLSIATAVSLLSIAPAQSNIDPDNAYVWGENIGWVNLYPSSDRGVVVENSYLSGYAWSENSGWIWFGDGPDDGTSYTNTGTDQGVNRNGAGELTGYAWGENIGWVVFDTTSVGGSQVVVDPNDGSFSGYAWGENVGWINFGEGFDGPSVAPDEEFEKWIIF